MSEKKTPAKKPRGRVPQAYGSIDPNFSTKVLKWNLELFKFRDDKPKTVEEMQNTIASFFEICAKYQMIPTVERSFGYY